jgi:hypothetical protein
MIFFEADRMTDRFLKFHLDTFLNFSDYLKRFFIGPQPYNFIGHKVIGADSWANTVVMSATAQSGTAMALRAPPKVDCSGERLTCVGKSSGF